ncbi:DMT family transporter [Psychromicrobium lacuslunae]|uniref:DMT family transporter n=1 Tax=Psychromicrobium lacuslunae TaxID=1618207 RepID=UPI00138E1C49|nr:DMT family transporter [Psychromicrobium lacuslunae]
MSRQLVRESPAKTGVSRATVLLTIAMAGWGTIGLFAQGAKTDPITIAAWRCVFAVGSLILMSLLVGAFRASRFTARAVTLTLVGGIALVANWILLFAAFDATTITIATVSYHMEPFFLVAIGSIIARRAPSRLSICWLLIGFTGLIFTTRFLRFDGLAIDSTSLIGPLAGLGAGLLYAVATLLAQRTEGIHPQVMTLMQCALGALVLLPFAGMLDWNGTSWWWIAAMGIIHTGILYWFLYAAARKVSTITLAALSFVNPAVAVLTDILLTGKLPTAEQLLGIALIIAATLAVTLGPANQRDRPHNPKT